MIRYATRVRQATAIPVYGKAGALRLLEGLALGGLAAMVMVVSRFPGLTPFVLYGVVPAAALSALLYTRFRLIAVPELVLWGAFLGWGLAGALHATAPGLVLGYVRILLGIAALWIPLSILIAGRGRFPAFLWGVLASAIFVFVRAMGSGLAFGPAGRIVTDIITNPNGLAFLFLYGVMAAVYLAVRADSKTLRTLLFSAATVLSYGIMATGSRKTFIALLVFAMVYMVWRRASWKYRTGIVAVGLAAFLLADPIMVQLEAETAVGQRLEAGHFESSADYRQLLIEDALDAFVAHPVAGVGLGNFVLHSFSGQYAHNDFAEIAATTGLLGLLLYGAIYAMFAWRIWTLSRRRKGRSDLSYDVVFLRATMITIMVIGLGAPIFLSLNGMLMIGALCFYSYYLERRMAADSKVKVYGVHNYVVV